jgi:hypothetical protein
LLPTLEQISVEQIAVGPVAAVEEQSRGEFATGGELGGTLLNEASEGCKT